MDSLFVLKDASGGVVGLTYSGVSSGAPSASSNNGKIAYFSDKPDSTGGYFYARNGIWDRVGGGPVVIDTIANITSWYNATTYDKCQAFATNIGPYGSPVYASGGSWIYAGSADRFQSISAVTYGAYGPTAMTINGNAYAFTYSGGKIATVVGEGKTKTYTWSGDDLVSVVVS